MKKYATLIAMSVLAICASAYSVYRFYQTTEAKQESSFQRPGYTNVTMEEARKALFDDIEAHRQDVDALIKKKSERPFKERYVLQSEPPASTWAEMTHMLAEFHRQRITQNYIDTTSDDQKTQAACIPFLDAVTQDLAGNFQSADRMPELITRVKETNSTDPIIKFYLAIKSTLPEQEMVAALKENDSILNEHRINAFNRAYHSFNLHYYSAKVAGHNEAMISKMLFQAIDAFVEHLESESLQTNPRLTWNLYERFLNNQNPDDMRDVLLACWRSEKIPLWIKHMAGGHYFKQIAWKHRGTDAASKVGDQQWKEFAKYERLSEEHFLRAWQLAPQYPESATALIGIAMAGNTTYWSTKDWFYEAVHAQFDYSPAYNSYLYSLSPRWGGSHLEMLKLAADCLGTKRFETFVPGVYLQVVFDNMLGETGDLQSLAQNPVVANLGKQLSEDLSAAIGHGVVSPSDNLDAWGNLVRLMVLSGEYDTARMIYEKHGRGILGTGVLGIHGMKAAHVRGLAFAATGPAREEVKTLDSFLKKPQPDNKIKNSLEQAEQSLEQACGKDAQPESQPYYDDVRVIVQQMKQYHSDEWVDLKFDHKLTGWYMHAADFSLSDEGILELKTDESILGIQLRPLARFSPPFICEAEVGRLGGEYAQNGAVSLIYGDELVNALYSRQPARALLVKPGTNSFRIWLSGDISPQGERIWSSSLTRGEFHHLRLVVWKDRIEFFGERDFFLAEPMPEGVNRDGFTIGELIPVTKPNLMKVRNARIHRLRATPPPLGRPSVASSLVDFYLKFTEIDPLCPSYWLQAATVCYHAGRNEDAARCFGKGYELAPSAITGRDEYAGVLLALDRLPEAGVQFRMFVERNESNVEANTGLAWVLATVKDDALRNGTEALHYAEKACQLSARKNWYPLCALALAHAELKQWDEADKAIAESKAIAPEDRQEYVQSVIDGIDKERASKTGNTEENSPPPATLPNDLKQ